MKRITALLPLLLLLLAGACKKEKSSLTILLPDAEDGTEVELVTYLDSVPLAKDSLAQGRAEFQTEYSGTPQLVQIMMGGKVQGFAVLEGEALTFDGEAPIAEGGKLNASLYDMAQKLDVLEEKDEMQAYSDAAYGYYEANRENPAGQYMLVEWLKFTGDTDFASKLATAPEEVRKSPKVEKYRRMAELRSRTAPGMQYADFEAEDAEGNPVKLSDLMEPGKYTLVDFWASWCRYCVKEIPDLKELHNQFGGKNVVIVGVAVRDTPEDTRQAVDRHGIPWKVLYNAQRRPYDIYGFAGIPHHILIAPDGTIVSRGETVEQIRERLTKL